MRGVNSNPLGALLSGERGDVSGGGGGGGGGPAGPGGGGGGGGRPGQPPGQPQSAPVGAPHHLLDVDEPILAPTRPARGGPGSGSSNASVVVGSGKSMGPGVGT